MAKHYNPSIILDTQRIFNLKAGDMLGSDVGNMIVPVVPIQRICNIVANNIGTATGALTIYTIPANKDFYLVGGSMSVSDTVLNDGTSISMRATLDDKTIQLITFAKTTLTVFNQTSSFSLPVPIKLDRGTSISVFSSFGAGSQIKAGNIFGYTVETTS